MTTDYAARCREIADIAEAAPDHNQADFFLLGADFTGKTEVPLSEIAAGFCGTSACIAGYAALRHAPPGTSYRRGVADFCLPDGRIIDADQFAGDVLGLTLGQRRAIFYCFDERAAIARLRAVAENPAISADALRERFPETGDDDEEPGDPIPAIPGEEILGSLRAEGQIN